MKALLTAAALAALALSPNAFAETPASQSQPGSQTTLNANQNQSAAAAQKIRQDLTNAGFTDVKVVAESFVVQAKTKDGNPVVMTIGPHGMSVFEAMNSTDTNSHTNTTGSTSNSTSGSSGSGSAPKK
jgi:opacity protein-like surface antigen